MTKRGLKYLLLTLGLAIYLVVALGASRSMASEAPCMGVDIVVDGDNAACFVTPKDIDFELDGITASASLMNVSSYNLQELEDKLNALPNVERANCMRTSDDHILIEVQPMIPVARVYDKSRRGSFYINHDGKHLQASSRYRISVPVIVGYFSKKCTPADVIPLIERVEQNAEWKSLVASYEVTRRGDIVIIPTLTGHVVNFGNTDNIDNKFQRLRSFYAQVMPVKGWNYYDTISVKFAGQIVAQAAPGKKSRETTQYDDNDFDDEVIPIDDTITDSDLEATIPKLN